MSRFNPPPNWPEPPEGWSPPAGWSPDPTWGPVPEGWQLWHDDAAGRVAADAVAGAPSTGDPTAGTTTDRSTEAHGPVSTPPTHSHDVFVSYASADKPVADAVVARLEQAGVRCWFAPRDVMPGFGFGDAIVHAIQASKVMVVVLSDAANQSEHIPREVDRALANKAVILPFRIEGVEPGGSLAYYFAGAHWLDAMTPPLESHIAELADVVRAILDARSAAKDTSPPLPHAAVALPAPPRSSRRKTWIVAAAGAVILVGAVVGAVAAIRGNSSADQSPVSSASTAVEAPALGGSSVGVAPKNYGDDPALDALWDACTAGDMGACDELFMTSPSGSDYENIGVYCGDPVHIWKTYPCSETPESGSSVALGSLESATVIIGDQDLSGEWQTSCYHYADDAWITLNKDDGSYNIIVLDGIDGPALNLSGVGSSFDFGTGTLEGSTLAAPTLVVDGPVFTVSGEAYDLLGEAGTELTFTITATCSAWDEVG